MRLLELEIHNVRGIRHLLLKPEGKNLVIWGPNGSGKSAVVDAIDFLLTGRVSRLTGGGTGGISLDRHGPHVDHRPEEASVRARLQLPGLAEPVDIRRCMAQPKQLECARSVAARWKAVEATARRGQHVLTRREILRYVTSSPSTRAQEIQALLDLGDVEDVRKALVRVHHEADKALRAAQQRVQEAQRAACATLRQPAFHPEAALHAVNEQRGMLGGMPLPELRADLKAGLAPPASAPALGEQGVSLPALRRDLAHLDGLVRDDSRTRTGVSDGQLRAWIARVRSDAGLARALERRHLDRLGLGLLDETGACPLCDAAWPPGHLRAHLQERLDAAADAEQYQTRIAQLASTLSDAARTAGDSLVRVLEAARGMAAPADDVAALEAWLRELRDLIACLAGPLAAYPDDRFPAERVECLLAPAGLDERLDRLEAAVAARYVEATPQQAAWDTLTRLEENLKALERAEADYARARLFAQRADLLLASFAGARDAVLGRLYDGVRDRFVELYRAFHGPDEAAFSARLEPRDAGVDFEVDFHGRGAHPPHALHSEGHQDSMGLCLYLALAEQLTERLIDLTILDDVVMSVDVDHRRELCHLLASTLRDRQFLITTHDKTWANQLKHAGVVSGRGMVELYNWSLDSGPRANCGVDMWERIDEALGNDDVPDAAARLRRSSEEFFSTVCDALEAPVRYKLSGRWELNDYLSGAIGQYRKLLKQAKKTEQSWGNQEQFGRLNELESTAGQIFARCDAERSAVNANVHYNAWANFSRQDFRPVVEAFQDLYNLFTCTQCGGVLRLAAAGGEPAAVRCACGKVNWNLAARPNIEDTHSR